MLQKKRRLPTTYANVPPGRIRGLDFFEELNLKVNCGGIGGQVLGSVLEFVCWKKVWISMAIYNNFGGKGVISNKLRELGVSEMIVSLVSSPTFEPNEFVHGLDKAYWNSLIKNDKKPLANKALSGLYPPGSTIKPIVALSALENDVISPKKIIKCTGKIELYGHPSRELMVILGSNA